jgi:phenylalanyl-tRNA synthetase beta chain
MMSGKETVDQFLNDNNLKNYAKLIKDSEFIPVVMDNNNNILSLPPLINSEFSKLSVDTKDILIEITAND